MRMDELAEFCDATALSTAATTTGLVAGDVIDTNTPLNTLKDLGTGEQLYLVIQVLTQAAPATGLPFQET